jgi:hypothetical protein
MIHEIRVEAPLAVRWYAVEAPNAFSATQKMRQRFPDADVFATGMAFTGGQGLPVDLLWERSR